MLAVGIRDAERSVLGLGRGLGQLLGLGLGLNLCISFVSSEASFEGSGTAWASASLDLTQKFCAPQAASAWSSKLRKLASRASLEADETPTKAQNCRRHTSTQRASRPGSAASRSLMVLASMSLAAWLYQMTAL